MDAKEKNSEQKNANQTHFECCKRFNVSKIKKSFLPNIAFILNVLSENKSIFVWMALYF